MCFERVCNFIFFAKIVIESVRKFVCVKNLMVQNSELCNFIFVKFIGWLINFIEFFLS